jgi:hypothetical protein
VQYAASVSGEGPDEIRGSGSGVMSTHASIYTISISFRQLKTCQNGAISCYPGDRSGGISMRPGVSSPMVEAQIAKTVRDKHGQLHIINNVLD